MNDNIVAELIKLLDSNIRVTERDMTKINPSTKSYGKFTELETIAYWTLYGRLLMCKELKCLLETKI